MICKQESYTRSDINCRFQTVRPEERIKQEGYLVACVVVVVVAPQRDLFLLQHRTLSLFTSLTSDDNKDDRCSST